MGERQLIERKPKTGGSTGWSQPFLRLTPALFWIVLTAGLIGSIWWLVSEHQDDAHILREAVFREVVPYLFQHDRLYFWGRTERTSGYYILDLTSGRIQRHGDSKEIFSLREGARAYILDDSSGQSLLLRRKGEEKKMTDSLPALKKPVSVSPVKNAFVYATQTGSDRIDLRLYTVADGRDTPLKEGVKKGAVSSADWARWSADGQYLLIDDEIFRTEDGQPVKKLNLSEAVWSPDGARLAYVVPPKKGKAPQEESGDRPRLLGKRLEVLHMDSGKVETMFRGAWIAGTPVWDSEGRFLAFPTAKQRPKEPYFEAVHVTDGHWFHYIEQEQNRMPTRLHHLTLSPGADYLCYAVNGILKLVDLRTQESRVYDGYNQVQSEPDDVRFDSEGVWLAKNNGVLLVTDHMEEKEVYRTPRQVLGFYLSAERDRMLIRERAAKGELLRLVDLKEMRDAAQIGTGRTPHETETARIVASSRGGLGEEDPTGVTRLVRPKSSRSAVAGEQRSLSDLGIGGYASTNPRRYGDPLL